MLALHSIDANVAGSVQSRLQLYLEMIYGATSNKQQALKSKQQQQTIH